MDLLSGYGSDSTSSSSEENHIAVQSTALQEQPQIVPPGQQSLEQPLNQEIDSSTKQLPRRRKLLSLNNVLPAHIVERLTRRQVQGENESDSEDSNTTDKRPSKTSNKTKVNNNKSSKGKSQEISSLLQELGETKTKGQTSTETNLTSKAYPNSLDPAPKETPGLAFTIVRTEITSRRKRDASPEQLEVVHVHADKVQQQPLSPPPQTSTIRRPPTVSNYVRAAPSIPTPPPQPDYATSVNSPSQNHEFAQEHENYQHEDTRPQKTARQQRRELESALRRGDTTAVLQHGANVVSLECPSDITDFKLDAGEHAQEIMASKLRGKAHHVTVNMYDPKAGQTVATKQITGRHKQRHQINQLAASAYSYEAQLLTSKTNQNKRVDAKRKYGW